ncbi:MAG: SLC13 family permease [Thermoflexales bacterium]|nr:SLC13 family permease [Thermoflexales bacterium]MCS7323736.1 SLC13 family permease [Thermoflexales bacterium]MCX7939578.1 SLC13 family permease [Thermoflexales bacterium]MDW8054519.1 SLC13 family permease [Anaerolineae bacterium]MDW8292862.1 SLC13 family permease [Anaerolineae bacterium]
MPAQWLTVLIGCAAFALMLSNRLRADAVAWLVAIALGLLSVVPPERLFEGFSSPAVITIIGISVIAQGLHRSGATRRMSAALLRLSGGSERGMVAAVMSAGALLSLVMNNIAAAAVILPSAVEALRRQKLAPSRVMLPLAIGTELGGMATLLTTGNLIVSAALVASGTPGYGLLDFLPIGGPIAVIGILFVTMLGRHLLPRRDGLAPMPTSDSTALAEVYALPERLNALRVQPNSPLANAPLGQSGIGSSFGISVLAVVRNGRVIYAPTTSLTLRPHDVLLTIGRRERAEQAATLGLALEDAQPFAKALESSAASWVEVMLAPRSRAAGQTLRQLRFRDRFGTTVVAIWHGGRSVRTDLADIPLEFGDTMLVYGSEQALSLLQSDPDFLVLRASRPDDAPRRMVVASGIVALALAAAALNVVSVPLAMMSGALALVLTRCLSLEEAYRAVEWRAVFLIAGMWPLATALTHSGLAKALGHAVVDTLAGGGVVAVGTGLLIATVLLAQVTSGQVSAAVLAPIAISTANALGADPRALAMFVAVGSSITFLTPAAHPVNAFVMGPGNYTAADYPRVGLPLTALVIALAVPLIAWAWRL